MEVEILQFWEIKVNSSVNLNLKKFSLKLILNSFDCLPAKSLLVEHYFTQTKVDSMNSLINKLSWVGWYWILLIFCFSFDNFTGLVNDPCPGSLISRF